MEKIEKTRYFYFLDRFEEGKYDMDPKLLENELITNEWHPIVSSDIGMDEDELFDIGMDEDTMKQWRNYLERRIVTSPSIVAYKMYFSKIINDLINNKQILCTFTNIKELSIVVNSKSMLNDYYKYSLPLGIVNIVGNYVGYNTWKSLNKQSDTIMIENNCNYSLVTQSQIFDSSKIISIEQLCIKNPDNLKEYNIQTYIINTWSFSNITNYICRIGGNLYDYTSYFGFVTPKYIDSCQNNVQSIIGYDLEGYSLCLRLIHANNWTIIYQGKEVLKHKPQFVVQGSWTTIMIQINKLNGTIKFVFGKGDIDIVFNIKEVANNFFQHICSNKQSFTLAVTTKIRNIAAGQWGIHLMQQCYK